MRHLKTYEKSENRCESFAIAIVNFINKIYKNEECYYVKAGLYKYHVIRGERVVLSIENNNGEIIIELYNLGYIKVTKKIYKYLTHIFIVTPRVRGVLRSGRTAYYNGYIVYKKDPEELSNLIDMLTIDKYEEFLLKEVMEPYNL